MESLKNRDSFHQTVDIPHYVDRSLDPINPLFCYNPIAANPNNATFSQEPYLCCNPIAANPNNATFSQEPYLYPHDLPEQKIWKDAWIHESVGILAKEAKPTEAMACKSLAPQSFPCPEEQPFGKGEITDAESSKRRKIRKPEKGPIYIFKTRSENNVVEDGYKWRKYGTKILKGSPNPRGYYRCSESNCSVKKKVERDPSDPGLLLTTYEGTHNHESHCVIYYIWEPIMLPEPPGSKPAIVSVNAGVCSEI